MHRIRLRIILANAPDHLLFRRRPDFCPDFALGYSPLEVPDDSAVALAHYLLQAMPVCYCDSSPSIADQTLILQRLGDANYSCPMHPEHFADRFLRKRKLG